MSEYISKEELKDYLEKNISFGGTEKKFRFYDIIDSLPSADVRPNIHAYWEDLEPDKDILFKSNMPYRCTACGQRAGKHKVSTYKYCPSCGAIMDGEPKGEKGTE